MSYLALFLLLAARASDSGASAALSKARLPLAACCAADLRRPGLRLFDGDVPRPANRAVPLSKVRPWIAGGLDDGREGLAFAAGAGFVFH